MSSDIVSMSHGINDGSCSSSSSSSSSYTYVPGKMGKKEVPTPKSPKSPSKNTRFKETEPGSSDPEDILLAKLWTKIDAYMESKYLGPALEGLTPPDRKASYSVVKGFMETVNHKLHQNYKRALVEKMFKAGLQLGETMMVRFLELDHMIGSAKFLASPDQIEEFQPELEEIAIELGDSWIPSAKMRLAFKVISAFQDIANGGAQRISKEEDKETYSSSSEESDGDGYSYSKRPPREEGKRRVREPRRYSQQRRRAAQRSDEEDGIPEGVGIFDSSQT